MMVAGMAVDNVSMMLVDGTHNMISMLVAPSLTGVHGLFSSVNFGQCMGSHARAFVERHPSKCHGAGGKG